MTEGSWISLDVSPDGSRIVFTSDRSGGHNVWIMSPDGGWIAYATWDGEAGHLHKVRADGGGSPVRLTERSAVYVTPA